MPAGGDEQRVGSLGRIIIWLVDAALLDRVLAKSSVIRLQQIEDPFAVLLKMWWNRQGQSPASTTVDADVEDNSESRDGHEIKAGI